jgi:hypothetical protein
MKTLARMRYYVAGAVATLVGVLLITWAAQGRALSLVDLSFLAALQGLALVWCVARIREDASAIALLEAFVARQESELREMDQTASRLHVLAQGQEQAIEDLRHVNNSLIATLNDDEEEGEAWRA